MTERDHKELSDLLGVDPAPTRPPKETGPLGVDPHKPVADAAAAQVAAAGPGRAGQVRRQTASDHPVLVLPYNPVRPKRDSAEIKRFLEERKPMRPGTIQVLLVLRTSLRKKRIPESGPDDYRPPGGTFSRAVLAALAGSYVCNAIRNNPAPAIQFACDFVEEVDQTLRL